MKRLRITVEGRVYDVTVEELEDGAPAAASTPQPRLAASSMPAPAPSDGDVVSSQIAGLIVSVDVSIGQTVAVGDPLLVLEAMKMNTTVAAPRAGTVSNIRVSPGDSVEDGQALLSLS